MSGFVRACATAIGAVLLLVGAVRAEVSVHSDTLASAAPSDAGTVRRMTWEDLPAYRHRGLSSRRLGVTLAGVAAYDVAFYQTLKKPWWNGEKSDFHAINDWWGNYAMETDKLGHAFAGQSFALISAEAYEWSGMSRRQALFWGGVTSVATLTQIEVLDGYTSRFGFSTADYAANIAGAFFPLAQEAWRPLKVVTFKMSYHPARFEPQSRADNLLEDYDRQAFWLAFNVHRILPHDARRYWPEWLQVAVGYGVENAFDREKENRLREFYLALDFDPTRLDLGDGLLARALAPLRYVHLPAPTIRVREDGTTFFALYF